jgi:cytochrome c oxidase subunit 2
VLVLFGATWLTLNTVEARAPEPAVEVRVTAFRWGWQFDYPDPSGAIQVRVVGDVNAPPELAVPVGETLHITLEATDVVHAFFVPRLLFKRDMIPGRVNAFDVTIETPGTYPGVCAEFCGLFHARMPFTLRAMPRAEFDAWLAAQPRLAGGTAP